MWASQVRKSAPDFVFFLNKNKPIVRTTPGLNNFIPALNENVNAYVQNNQYNGPRKKWYTIQQFEMREHLVCLCISYANESLPAAGRISELEENTRNVARTQLSYCYTGNYKRMYAVPWLDVTSKYYLNCILPIVDCTFISSW